jgi:hypothetical protein
MAMECVLSTVQKVRMACSSVRITVACITIRHSLIRSIFAIAILLQHVTHHGFGSYDMKSTAAQLVLVFTMHYIHLHLQRGSFCCTVG